MIKVKLSKGGPQCIHLYLLSSNETQINRAAMLTEYCVLFVLKLFGLHLTD
jgi:hypothetical protein